jgi:hypothetical protein
MSSKNNNPVTFITAITLCVSVSFDHHLVCMNKTSITFMLIKMDPFFQCHRLKILCMFCEEYTKIWRWDSTVGIATGYGLDD